MAKPGDTYLGITPYSPVCVMDADPMMFMRSMLYQTPEDFDKFFQTVERKRPRFIGGFGQGIIWMGPEKKMRGFPDTKDDVSFRRNAALLNRYDVLARYKPLSRKLDVVLVRVDAPQSQPSR